MSLRGRINQTVVDWRLQRAGAPCNKQHRSDEAQDTDPTKETLSEFFYVLGFICLVLSAYAITRFALDIFTYFYPTTAKDFACSLLQLVGLCK